MTIETTALDCGVTVVTERMDAVRSVALGFWVGVGSRDETDELAGASHFLEHLLFKGTEARSATAIAEAIDEVGGDLNAFTTKEYTAFEVRLLAEHTDLGLDVLSDIMWAPAFRADEVEAERQVILEEILMQRDEPGDLVHDLFAEAVFPGHPLGRSTLGTEESIEAMARDAIARFHATYYRPRNIVVAAAGNVDHERIAAGVEARFCAIGEGETPTRTAPPEPGCRVLVHRRETEQAHVVLGIPGVHRDHPDRYAVDVINQALGGGLSSRLFQEVRERRGLAYNVYSYRASFAEAGVVALYAGTAPRHARTVVDLFSAELARVGEEGLTAREVEIAKGHLRGSTLLGLEDSGARMARIGRSQLVHGTVPAIDAVLARIEAITVDDIRRVAAGLAAEPRTLAVIGPVRESDFA